jgi:hypothetical protein
MTLTHEQTIKAVEELKANEWMALGGMSPEAQEFLRENNEKPIWNFLQAIGKWSKNANHSSVYPNSVYRLDPSYTLQEIEPEYLEFDVEVSKYGKLEFHVVTDDYLKRSYDVYASPVRLMNYQLEGFKFEGWDDIWNDYKAWSDPNQKTLIFGMKPKDTWYKKVFATSVVYRKVG